MLSDVQLRTLKTPGKHFDGGGLYLEVTPAGGRYWRLKYRHGGKERRLAFGVYPEVSLKTARERRAEARAILDSGADPGALKREEKAKAERESAATLEAVAREYRLGSLALVSVYGTHRLWSRLGFVERTSPALAAKLAAYGPTAHYLVRPL